MCVSGLDRRNKRRMKNIAELCPDPPGPFVLETSGHEYWEAVRNLFTSFWL
jgi:hypothetical protein